MSVRRRLKDSVVIENPSDLETGTNEYGDEDESIPDYWDAVAVAALVSPTASTESEADRETVAQSFDLYVAPEVTITANSRVRFLWLEDEELLCRVLGEPTRHRTGTKGYSHTVARLEVVSG